MTDTIEWETIACPLCGSKNYEHWRTVADRFKTLNDQSFSIVSCRDCGFRYLNPRPRENSIGSFYSSEEYDPFISTQDRFSPGALIYTLVRKYSVWRKRVLIESLQPEGSILDVGCGTGEFLVAMQKHEWEVTGMEPDAKARANAESHGVRVYQDLENINGKAFNVITLWHVLEHIHNLKRALEKLMHLMESGDKLVLAMPNVDSWDMKRYQENWIALDTPRHLYHFTEKDVEKIAAQFRLQLIQTRPLWLDTFYNVLLSEGLHREVTGSRFRPLYATKTIIGSFVHDRQNSTRRSSSSVYILKKE